MRSPARWPGVRHIRWWLGVIGLNRHLERWRSLGFVGVPQQSDLDHLDAIWNGER